MGKRSSSDGSGKAADGAAEPKRRRKAKEAPAAGKGGEEAVAAARKPARSTRSGAIGKSKADTPVAAAPAKMPSDKKRKKAPPSRKAKEAKDAPEPESHAQEKEVAIVERKSETAVESTSTTQSSVVYLGHLPHGFYEHQLRGYFAQFGEVTKVRVSRSKSSGKSKGYAYLEFSSSDVARIAAEAMHDYLMFGQKLECRVVPAAEVHPSTFKGANKRFKKIPWRKIEQARHNRDRTDEQEAKRVRRLARSDEKRRKRLAEAGIEYDFEGFAPTVAAEGGKGKGKGKGKAKKTRPGKKAGKK